MRDDITSIPISEIFEEKDGCPICRLRNLLEKRVVEYITGAAMMEPDVRTETNKAGFCFDHYRMLLAQRNRLSVALMMESHLASLDKRLFGGLPKGAGKRGKSTESALSTCFVCSNIEHNMERMLVNVCRLWERERDFRTLFAEQPSLCLPHFAMLTETANACMSRRTAPDFCRDAQSVAQREMAALRADVSHFCKMFDYRNAGENADWGTSKDAIERAVHFLTTREVK